ncbi:hypothetical protein ACLK2E_02660 [Escherichia coli]
MVKTLVEAVVLVFPGDVPVPAELPRDADSDYSGPVVLLGTLAIVALFGFSDQRPSPCFRL